MHASSLKRGNLLSLIAGIGPRQGIHFIVLLSTPPLPPPVTSPHPSQPVAALPVKTTSECWFARQVQMLDGVSSLGFLCCHLGTPIQARIFSESAVSTWSLSAGLMWSLPSYILLDKLAWLFWFVTLEFQKNDCNISTLPFQEGEHLSKRDDPRQCGLLLDCFGIALRWTNSIPVVDPKCSKAYIVQLKTCIKPDPGCTQVWNLSQMHLSTFPKGMWALLDCSGTALRWSKWELFSSWRLMAVAYSWQM